jgi:hypothetical protein
MQPQRAVVPFDNLSAHSKAKAGADALLRRKEWLKYFARDLRRNPRAVVLQMKLHVLSGDIGRARDMNSSIGWSCVDGV